MSHPADSDRQTLQVHSKGVVKIGKTLFHVTQRMGGRSITAVWDLDGVVFASTEGETIAKYRWPIEGTEYVGISQARTLFRRYGRAGEASPTSREITAPKSTTSGSI